MPTENLSSNTEMVSELLPCPFCGEKPQITKHHREDNYSFMHRCQVLGPISWGFREDQQAHIDKWNARAQPDIQPHPEPIAWMVGTAFWWTKEEAERDAAATGLPIVGLGPMTGIATAETCQGEPVGEVVAFGKGLHEIAWASGRMPGLGAKLYTHADPGEVERLREGISKHWKVVCDQRAELETLRAQLAEQDSLLREKSGDLIRMAAHLISAPLFALQDLQDEDKKMTKARVDHAVEVADARLKDAAYELRRIADSFSASAEPNAPIEIDEPVCKGAWQLGTACGKCRRCKENRPA